MSGVILRDEFGLPVKASAVTVIERDECGLPIRSRQRTFTETAETGGHPASTPQRRADGAPALTVVTVRDAAGFPIKVGVVASDYSRVDNASPDPDTALERATSAPSTGKSKTLLSMMKPRGQYEMVNRGSSAAHAPPPPCPILERETRRERSADLSGVLRRVDSHMADHGQGCSAVCHSEDDEYAVTKFYARNQVYGYPNSNGSVWSNYIRFVGQQHPLLSIALVHHKHPFTRKQRIGVFMCVLAFAFFVEIALLDSFYYSELEVCDAGCDETDGVCVGGANDGMPESEYNEHCQYYEPWVLALICGTVIVPYNTLLMYLSSCSCLHGKSFFHFHLIGRSCKKCMEHCGGRLMIFVIVYSIGMVGWGLFRCHVANDNFNIVATLIQAKLWSFAEWFVWTAPYFAFRYPIDRKRFYSRIGKNSDSQRNLSDGTDSESAISRENSRNALIAERRSEEV